MSKMVYELRITLKDVGVPVWRVVQVDKTINFHELHLLIQAAFDWMNYHLYGFHVDKSNGEDVKFVEITDREIEDTFMSINLQTYKMKETILSDWLIKPKDKITYTYDYGDNWEHIIELLKIIETDAKVEYPRCIRAKNDAPPEDSRFEIIEGKIDLVAPDNKEVRDEVNDMIQLGVDDVHLMEELTDEEKSHEPLNPVVREVETSPIWEMTLEKAKKFFQAKPWESLTENDLFVIVEPNTNQYLFCKISGQAGEEYGLEIYIGLDGFFTLLALVSGEDLELDGLHKAHVLFVSFVDREELQIQDYNLIKAHSTTFHGKSSWPCFVSFEPGYYPWIMEEEDATLTHFVMSEVMQIAEEVKDGLVIPAVLEERSILIRELVADVSDGVRLENRFSDLDTLLREDVEESLVLSELEIKRFSKLRRTLSTSIEFSITPVKIPVLADEESRPFYAPIAVAIDVETGEVYYQETFDEPQNIYWMQQTFLKVMIEMGGIPSVIYTDSATARVILPFLDVLDFNLQIVEELEGIDEVVDDLTQSLLDE